MRGEVKEGGGVRGVPIHRTNILPTFEFIVFQKSVGLMGSVKNLKGAVRKEGTPIAIPSGEPTGAFSVGSLPSHPGRVERTEYYDSNDTNPYALVASDTRGERFLSLPRMPLLLTEMRQGQSPKL